MSVNDIWHSPNNAVYPQGPWHYIIRVDAIILIHQLNLYRFNVKAVLQAQVFFEYIEELPNEPITWVDKGLLVAVVFKLPICHLLE